MAKLYELITVFVVLVLPLWLFLHYRHASRRMQSELPREVGQQLEQLERQVEEYQARIEALETILDENHPDWRRRG